MTAKCHTFQRAYARHSVLSQIDARSKISTGGGKWFRDRLNLSTSRGMWWSLGVPARICTKIGTVVTYRHPELVCKYFNMYIKLSRFISVLLYLDSKSKVQDSKSNLLDSKTKLQEREIKLLKSEVKLNRAFLIYMLK